ncbi:hypothetical protein AVEN_148678-1 [Araneus ventricosus]|uniref:Uncharacterized protein n=1 Tax=Araneus ventricosus TaxID=182803 RepID=A0A4Y2G6K6_ARAVE|nr:hypothetical protein AVEN_148678-1 [Araneus ventricosus]
MALYPQSLFDDAGLRTGKKSDMVKFIDKMCKISNKLPENTSYVLDEVRESRSHDKEVVWHLLLIKAVLGHLRKKTDKAPICLPGTFG